MQKQNSKKKFLEKLYISLSFYFGDDDCDSIIKDYEEWFENEEMAEKSEHEICSGLGKPFDIARNLYKDSKEGKEHTCFITDNCHAGYILCAMHQFVKIL